MKRLCLLAILAPGCAAPPLSAPPHSDLSSVAPLPQTRAIAPSDPNQINILFTSRKGRLKFFYPSTWHPVADDTLLSLAPLGETTLLGDHLVIDMPDLPFHIPGLIPIKLVVSGFEDDLKKRYKDVAEAPVTDRTVGGTAAKEVNARACGEKGNAVVKAVLLVRGDHVYLIDAESSAATAPAAANAFNTVVDSLKWTN